MKAVIAESFERIHRSNLIGMGVLPLCFVDGQTIASLGLDGSEEIDIEGLQNEMSPQDILTVKARKPDGRQIDFRVVSMLNTALDVNYYRNNGILQTVLRKLMDS